MEEEKRQSNYNSTNAFSPREMVLRYIHYFPWVIISVVLFLFLAYLQIRYSNPIYNVRAKILVKDENPYGSGNDKFQDIFMMQNSSQNLNDETEIIKSRPMAERVVNALGLQLMIYNKGSIRTSLIHNNDVPFLVHLVQVEDSTTLGFNLPVNIINEKEFQIIGQSSKLNFGQVFSVGQAKIQLIRNGEKWKSFSSNEFLINWVPLKQRASELSRTLVVTQGNDFSNVLTLSYNIESIKVGIDIVNQYMQEYRESSLEGKREIAENTLQFINNQLDTVKRNLGGVERNLQEFREQNQIFVPDVQSQLTFGEVSTSMQQSTEQEVKLRIVDFLTNYLKDSRNPYRTVPASLGIEEPSFLQQIVEFNQLQLNRERALKTIPSSNPLISDMETSIERLRTDMLTNLSNIRHTYEMAINKLNSITGKAQAQIQTIPRKEKQMREVTRQQGILQDLYSFLLQKKLETAISSASTISNIRIVEPAIGSSIPISPNRKSLYFIGLIIGVFLPVGAIMVMEYLNDKVKSKSDVEKFTNTPILGEVGHATQEEVLVVANNNRQLIAEQFRIIRTNLRYILPKVEKPVIMVTSSVTGEGKSFISTNLGAVLAISGMRTVILEFDIRKPKIMQGLGLKERKGITNYIVGNLDYSDIVHKVPQVENLFVVPCGPLPPNPSEMILDARVKELLDDLKKKFDAIIIDTAPVGLVSDAIVLGNYADAVVYVIRHNHTLKKLLSLVEDLYSKQKLPRMSVVINDIQTTSGYRKYYGYGEYGYGYGYGYGYASDYFELQNQKEKSFLNRWFKKRNK